MTTWNNRIMKHWYGGEGWYYTVHEVYYNKHHTPIFWTVEPDYPVGDDLYELKSSYEFISEAFNAPVLDYETGVDVDFYYMWE